nr:helix-turn-helix domain-containing protein [Pseudonocardia sp. ICBG162]
MVADGRAALAGGVSRREVAKAFGVSRRTVDRWAAGVAAADTNPGGGHR